MLYLNGRDIRKLPLSQRKAELKKILSGTDIQFGESFEIDGREMFAHACKLGLEGVVSKVRSSAYPLGYGLVLHQHYRNLAAQVSCFCCLRCSLKYGMCFGAEHGRDGCVDFFLRRSNHFALNSSGRRYVIARRG
ncbi:ATP-dependent DNA ligase [Bradyrhizobium sp. CCBAU 51745]|uniref:ATP-dependent DNA ligase n=1 Tax=Bradyrhizobium sp. CCBAU 51745 TaxID=1325099 RepID=UPI003FA42EC2